MTVETIITRTMSEVPRALAAGVVDITTGTLLGVGTSDRGSPEAVERAASASGELFEGQDVTTIEGVFQRMRGVRASDRYFKEIVIMSTELVHIFARLERDEPTVLVVVCRTDVDMGLALVKTRAITTAATV